MKPKEIAKEWLECYNRGDADALSGFYHKDAVNDRVADTRLTGRDAIVEMYRQEFLATRMEVGLERLHEAGQWIILEWVDQYGFRGCVFFLIEDQRITHQKSYWDNLTYRQKYDLPSSIH